MVIATQQPLAGARGCPAATPPRHALPARRTLGQRSARRAPAPLQVITPARTEMKTIDEVVVSTSFTPQADLLGRIAAPVKPDLEQMSFNLKQIVGNRHPMLMAAAEQIFGGGGKKLRPLVLFLVARATAQLQGLR